MLRFLGYAAAFVALYGLAVLTPAGQRVDDASLGAFPGLRSDAWMRMHGLGTPVLTVLCAAAGIAILWALLGRRLADATRGAAVLSAAALANLVLDETLTRPALSAAGYPHNTYPSGHAALALAAAVALAWTAGRFRVAAAAIAASCAGFVSGSALLSFSHRASDVVGGLLMTGAVAAAAAWPRWGGTARTTGPRRRGAGIAVGAALLVAAVSVAVAVFVPDAAAAALAGSAMALAAVALIADVTRHALAASGRGGGARTPTRAASGPDDVT